MPTPPQLAHRMAVLPANFFLGLHERLAQLKAQGRDIIRMDMGSPDLPPPPFIVEALQRAATFPDRHGYQPYGGPLAYRAAWADFYRQRFGVTLDPGREINGLLGSKQGVFHLSLAYVNPGDTVLVPDPGYITYNTGAIFTGAEIVYLPLRAEDDFLPDLKAIPAEVLRRAKILWLNYPNNPTGGVATLAFFEQVVALARTHGFIVAHDAPYTEITYDGYVAPSVLQVPGAKDVAVEFNSLSKSMNMGGWRLGAVLGNAEIVQVIHTMQSQIDSGGFLPVLEAGITALRGDQSWLMERNAIYCERRDLVLAGLRAAGLSAPTPRGAIYIWARLPAGFTDDAAFARDLLEQAEVTVTPGSFFGATGTGYIRISLGTPTPRLREGVARLVQWAAAGPAQK